MAREGSYRDAGVRLLCQPSRGEVKCLTLGPNVGDVSALHVAHHAATPPVSNIRSSTYQEKHDGDVRNCCRRGCFLGLPYPTPAKAHRFKPRGEARKKPGGGGTHHPVQGPRRHPAHLVQLERSHHHLCIIRAFLTLKKACRPSDSARV